MRRSTILPIAFLLVAAAARSAVIEGIAIRVNDRILTRTEMKAREDEAMKELIRTSGSISPAQLKEKARELHKKVVEETIREMLMLERADELGIVVEDSEVDESLDRMKAQNGIRSDEEFTAALAASGLTRAQIRESYRTNATIQRVVGREIQSRLEVTDEFLRTLYNNDKEKYRKPDRVRLSEILLLSGKAASERGEARDAAADARRRILSGEDFAAVAREVSQGGTREKGGDLGIVTKGELAPEIDSVVFALEQGAISEPIESKFGFHLLRVDETFPPAYTPFEEVKDKVRGAYQDAEFEKRLAENITNLRTRYYVKVQVDDEEGR